MEYVQMNKVIAPESHDRLKIVVFCCCCFSVFGFGGCFRWGGRNVNTPFVLGSLLVGSLSGQVSRLPLTRGQWIRTTVTKTKSRVPPSVGEKSPFWPRLAVLLSPKRQKFSLAVRCEIIVHQKSKVK